MTDNLLRAGLVGSEKVIQWYTSYLEDNPSKVREIIPSLTALIGILRNISVAIFVNFFSAL
jgi:hypothetical protein